MPSVFRIRDWLRDLWAGELEEGRWANVGGRGGRGGKGGGLAELPQTPLLS